MKIHKKSIIFFMLSFFLLFSSIFPSLILLSRISLNREQVPTPANSAPVIIWATDGIPICTANNSQIEPRIISDGADGAIMVWIDERNLLATGSDIYTQRIDSNGNFLWGSEGIAVCTADDDQSAPELVSDGVGGAIITWQDIDIYAQRIDSNGNSLWTPNGTSICSASEDQRFPTITSDGNEGAIITWQDGRNNTIYIQYINSTGDIQWDLDGILIAKGYWPYIIGDGVGGVVVAWEDLRNGSLGRDIYIQKINSSGIPQWTPNGVPICTMQYQQTKPQIFLDGTGNTIIAWEDDRKHFDIDIFIQKVNATGDIQWTPNGLAISTADRNQLSFELISDEQGGALIAWKDSRNYNYDIFIQRVNSTGDILWTQDGIGVCTEVDGQESVHLLKDGRGGAYIIWRDDRGTGSYWYDIYMQLINSAGNFQWILNGAAVSTAHEAQEFPQFINNQGQIIIVWQDDRDKGSTGTDIYAHKVIDNMKPTSTQPSFINTTKYTNETIEWTLTDDWGEGHFRVKANNTFGNYIIQQDWQPWTNNTPIIIQINRTEAGMFNYTIEFYDMYNLTGDPNTVIVNVEDGSNNGGDGNGGNGEEESSPNISFGYYFIIPLLFGTILLALITRRRSHNKS